MTFWHQWLLWMWYGGTGPWRRRDAARRRKLGTCPVMVLFYHRVADTVPNGWSMTTRQFARQIDWLRPRFDLISLEEAQRRLRSGRNDRPAVCITFDDGYADNCDFALPLLLKYGIPCTYFVSTNHIFHGMPFPHDVEAGIPLKPNTPEQIRELADAGIDIGAHTRTHADLSRVTDPQRLHDEVVTCREELESLTGRPVPYFAFPYGQEKQLTPAAMTLARQAGYAGVCSAWGGYNFPGDPAAGADPFHLLRIHADPEMVRLYNWLTVDPRKVRMNRRLAWEVQDAASSEARTLQVAREKQTGAVATAGEAEDSDALREELPA